MAEYGTLFEVSAEPRGSQLTATANVSDTELVIDYSGDFDTNGGILDLNGVRLAYTAIVEGDEPDDPDTLVLAEPLAAGADIDDSVLAVTSGNQIAIDYIGHVTMSGASGDPALARIPYNQVALWAVGQYDPPVPVVLSDDLHYIVDAEGRTPTGRTLAWNRDYADATADDTTVTVPLTWLPAPDSMQVKQRGVELDLDEWDYDADANSIVVAPSAGVVIHMGDRFRCYYDRDGAAGELVSSTTPIASIVGVPTVAAGLISSIALPAGTVAGNQLLLIHCGWTPGTTTDPRMTIDPSALVAGAAIPLGFIAKGVADGSGSPVTISTAADGFGNHYDITILVAIDASGFGTGAYANDPAPSASSANLPTVSASFAIAVSLERHGGGTTGAIVPGSGFTAIANDAEAGKVCATVAAWTGTDTPATTPADTYGFTGSSIDGWALAVYPMEG